MGTFFKFILISLVSAQAIALDLKTRDLDHLCNSGKTFVLIDLFTRNQPDFGYQAENSQVGMIDINGDGITDLAHGDLVLAQLRGTGVSVVTYGLKAYAKRPIEGALADIRFFIEKQRLDNVAAVVMPIAHSLSIPKLGALLFNDPLMTRKQVIDQWSQLKPVAVSYQSGVDTVYVQMGLLQELGVPVITPAGNQYGQAINLTNLMGSPGVGATIGKTSVPAPYSDHHKGTQLFRSGDVLSRLVSQGVDINHNGKADIPKKWLSEGMSIKEQVAQGLVPVKSIAELKKATNEPALIDAREWLMFMGIDEESRLTDYVDHYGDLIHYPSHLPFRQTASGIIQLAPAFGGDVVTINSGTSFSIGNVCDSAKTELMASSEY